MKLNELNLFKSKNSADKKYRSPFVMMILDGWGIAPSWGGNAITQANTSNFDRLWREYPSTRLRASGPDVGLPEGSPGNSEAGHLNIGAGRIVHQDLPLIDNNIESGKLAYNPVILSALKHIEESKSMIHLMGLLSKTGTHSHIKHIYPILKILKSHKVSEVYIHLFSDGRDSDPMSGIEMVREVSDTISKLGIGKIVSIMGRYYAMDRDNRWGRTARAYNALVKGEALTSASPDQVFSNSYAHGIYDEFIEPRLIVNPSQRMHLVRDNDAIIFFNFRSDRVRQLALSFVSESLPQFPDRQKLDNIFFSAFTGIDESKDVQAIFTPDVVLNPIAKIISEERLSQLHIAETEKFAHVTYFVNGGRNIKFSAEDHRLVPSPKVNTYDHAPRMSAEEITKNVLYEIEHEKYDFYIINFANPDMVGHTGNLKATMVAVSFVDQCMGEIVKKVLTQRGTAMIFADHGNAEQMVNPQTGDPDTEHTANPVPLIIACDKLKPAIKLQTDGSLSNIAPTAIELLGLDKPNDMSGKESLIIDTISNESRYSQINSNGDDVIPYHL